MPREAIQPCASIVGSLIQKRYSTESSVISTCGAAKPVEKGEHRGWQRVYGDKREHHSGYLARAGHPGRADTDRRHDYGRPQALRHTSLDSNDRGHPQCIAGAHDYGRLVLQVGRTRHPAEAWRNLL